MGKIRAERASKHLFDGLLEDACRPCDLRGHLLALRESQYDLRMRRGDGFGIIGSGLTECAGSGTGGRTGGGTSTECNGKMLITFE